MKRIMLIALLSAVTYMAVAQGKPLPKKQCTATTVKGTQCKNKTTGSYCGLHNPDKQCGVATTKGKPCKLPVKVKGAKCWRHS